MLNHSSVKSVIMDLLSSALIIIITVYAAMNAYLYLFQRKMVFIPVTQMEQPNNYGLHDTAEITLQTADNLDIIAWYTKAKHSEPTLLYLHGNAGNLGDRTEKLEIILKTGMGLLAVSYRGYGASQGSPTEEGLYADARAAIKWLGENTIEPGDIVLYGESLGSGVAIQMATEHNFRALILEAPYTSIAGRAAELYPYIPVKLLLKDQFKSIEKIGRVKTPVLIFHGYRDEVMPIHHGRDLLEAANEPKEARFYDNIGHTDFDLEEIISITHDFAKR